MWRPWLGSGTPAGGLTHGGRRSLWIATEPFAPARRFASRAGRDDGHVSYYADRLGRADRPGAAGALRSAQRRTEPAGKWPRSYLIEHLEGIMRDMAGATRGPTRRWS